MSGLHHDYHDNLYVLLKGQKQFLLFPPETASMMYTNGEIEYVHKNGRIVYKGQVESLKSFLAMHKRVMSWQMDQMLLM